MVQLHTIKPNTKSKTKKRVARGGKRGSYSGRGIKGQKSRAGRKMRPQIRDIIKKIPKKRGYRFSSFREKPVSVNLHKLEEAFKNGAEVNPRTLLKAGLIEYKKGKVPMVKLLDSGTLKKKLSVSGCQTSESAKKKIEKVGGKVK